MDAVLAKTIKELLFLNGSVVIPNIGKLYSVKKMALLDAVRGQVDPPQADIFLDTNAKINDGILADAYAKAQGISTYDAQKMIDDKTLDIQKALDKFELVTFEGLGRLYNDGIGKIHFLQDAINNNPDSFGLPSLKFETIKRSESPQNGVTTNEKLAAAVTTPVVNTFAVTPSEEAPSTILGLEKPAFTRYALIGAVSFALLALLFSQWRRLTRKTDAVVTTETISTDSTSLSTASKTIDSTTLSYASVPENVVTNSTTLQDTKTKKGSTKPKPAKEIETATTSSTSAQKDKTATIIVGAFGDANNIAKLEKWINNNDYQLYTKKRGNLTIIGAKVGYNNSDDLDAIVSKFKSRYGNDIITTK